MGVYMCVWSMQACLMSAQGLQAGGAISVCVYLLGHGCASACVFVCLCEWRFLSACIGLQRLPMYNGTGLWDPRRGRTPGEALARAGDTRRGWTCGMESAVRCLLHECKLCAVEPHP